MALLVLALLGFGALELVTAAAVSEWLGGPMITFLVIIATSAVGAFVTKREGLAAIRRVSLAVDAGQMPTDAVVDGAIAVTAGLLLLLPGFLSDVIAVVLLLPPVRGIARRRSIASAQRRVSARASTVTFGFGGPGVGGVGFGYSATARPRVDHDIIDLDGEEVVEGEIVELERPPQPPQ